MVKGKRMNNERNLEQMIHKNDQAVYQLLKKQSRQTHRIQEKIYDKVPEKVVSALNQAFLLAFENIFVKGMPLIEQTFNKKSLEIEHLSKNHHVKQSLTGQGIDRIKEGNLLRNRKNKFFSTTEGMVLGVLGIGIPDVPIFISTLLRSLYQTAMTYGFAYETQSERIYLLRLIRVAMTENEGVFYQNRQLDALGEQLDDGEIPVLNLEEEIRLTAETLSMAMLVAKFIMTFPVVGVVGGLYNPKTLHRIDQFAALKYEKRYLQKKKQENS